MIANDYVSYSMERMYSAFVLGKISRTEYCIRLGYLIYIRR